MKRLILMRHGDAPSAVDMQDSDRQLSSQGRLGVLEAATFLSKVTLDKLVVSAVKRTMETADLILTKTSPKEISYSKELYLKDSTEIIEFCTNIEDSVNTLMLIGHNPSIYQIALSLCSSEDEQYDYLIATGMQAARIIMIDFDITTWRGLKNTVGSITAIFTPSR